MHSQCSGWWIIPYKAKKYWRNIFTYIKCDIGNWVSHINNNIIKRTKSNGTCWSFSIRQTWNLSLFLIFNRSNQYESSEHTTHTIYHWLNRILVKPFYAGFKQKSKKFTLTMKMNEIEFNYYVINVIDNSAFCFFLFWSVIFSLKCT